MDLYARVKKDMTCKWKIKGEINEDWQMIAGQRGGWRLIRRRRWRTRSNYQEQQDGGWPWHRKGGWSRRLPWGLSYMARTNRTPLTSAGKKFIVITILYFWVHTSTTGISVGTCLGRGGAAGQRDRLEASPTKIDKAERPTQTQP